MLGSDPVSPDPKVIAAGRAAAAWARARRSNWTDGSVPPYVPSAEDLQFLAAREAAAEAAAAEPPPIPVPSGPSAGERASEALKDAIGPAITWGIRLAIVGVLGVGVYLGYPYVQKMLAKKEAAKSEETTTTTAPADKPAAVAKGSGPTASIDVKSDPPSQVYLDGKQKGSTPTILKDIKPGKHVIELRSNDGSVERALTLEAGDTATVDEQIFPGWVLVQSPIEVKISEGGRALSPDERGQVRLPPGKHDIRVTNTKLEYDEVLKVVVKPGEVARADAKPPRGTLVVTSSEPAEVFMDGNRLGETPLNGAAIDLGSHEVVVIRNGGGQRRFTITATTKPVTLTVDFSK